MIPPKKPTANGIISFVTGLLILLIAIGSFALSYNNLHQTALSHGVGPNLAYIWPLLIDFALVVFSLAVVQSNLNNEPAYRRWLMVALYTIATIAFNVYHAPANLAAQIVAVVAPVTLFLSFETLMAMLKNGVIKRGVVLSLADLAQQMALKTQELADFEAKRQVEIEEKGQRQWGRLSEKLGNLELAIEARHTELDTLATQQATLQAEIDKANQKLSDIQRQIEAKQKELNATQDATLVNVWDLVSHIDKATLDTQTRQAFVALLTNAKVSQKDIAEWAGKSIKTIQRDIAESNGLVKK